jgi:signal transduction histidine kinase
MPDESSRRISFKRTTGSPLRVALDVLLVCAAIAVDLLVWGGERDLRTGGTAPLMLIPLLTTLAYSCLLIRWRRPIAVFAVEWTYGLTGLLVPGYEPFAGLLIALHAVARTQKRQIAAFCLLSCAVPFGIDSFNATTQTVPDAWVRSLLTSAVLWVVLGLAVWGIARLAYAADVRSEEALRVQDQLAAAAIEEERTRFERRAAESLRIVRLRLAREMHDVVAHAVSTMAIHAYAAQTVIERQSDSSMQVHGSLDSVLESLRVIQAQGEVANEELKHLLSSLRAVDWENTAGLAEPRTLSDIAVLVQMDKIAGRDTTLSIVGRPQELGTSVEHAAYRVVQEALTNATKHGGAGSVQVSLGWGEKTLTVIIRSGFTGSSGYSQNDLRALNLTGSGFGLLGLRERVELIGGAFDAGPQNHGFMVKAVLPASGVQRIEVAV